MMSSSFFLVLQRRSFDPRRGTLLKNYLKNVLFVLCGCWQDFDKTYVRKKELEYELVFRQKVESTQTLIASQRDERRHKCTHQGECS
jgi:hypothetical protein